MPATASSQGKTFFTRRMGPLQRQLRQGEYGLFKYSPMFESDFVQISKQGGPIEIHNQEEIVTVAITSTSPVLLIPNVLLLARPIFPSEEHTPKLKAKFRRYPPVRHELIRLFPLRFVKITIHNAEKQQLRFKLANGRTFYLQLCPESDRREDLFDAWIRIVQLLRPPSETNFEEQKDKTKKLKGQGTSPILPAKGKNASSKALPTNKNWNIHTATKTAGAHPLVSSESNTSLQITKPSPKVDGNQPPESKDMAENMAMTKTEESPRPASPSPESPSPRSPSPETNKPESSSPQSPRPEGPIQRMRTGEKSDLHTRRKGDRGHTSRSASRHRGAAKKSNKLVALIRACSWRNPKKDKRGARAQGKGKKY